MLRQDLITLTIVIRKEKNEFRTLLEKVIKIQPHKNAHTPVIKKLYNTKLYCEGVILIVAPSCLLNILTYFRFIVISKKI